MLSCNGDKVAAYCAAAKARGEVCHLRACSNCQKPPAPGTNLRNCGKCDSTYYCSVDCQREHWQLGHKLVCEDRALERIYSPKTCEEGRDACLKADRASKKWFGSLSQTLLTKILSLAWTHRRQTPLVLLQTSTSGADMSNPRVTVLPRSVWETGNFTSDLVRSNIESLRKYVVDGVHRPDIVYYVTLDCKHAKQEGWSRDTISLIFPDHMDVTSALYHICHANTFDGLNTAIAQAETFLENTPVSTFPDTGTAAERYTSLTKAVEFYAQRRMMGFGNKVILKGRDPRLHGQEGIMNLGNNPDEADKKRPMISLEDGTQVSNIHFQVNVFYTLLSPIYWFVMLTHVSYLYAAAC